MSHFEITGCCESIKYAPSEYSDGAVKVNFPVNFTSEGPSRIEILAVIKDPAGLVALPSITNYLRDRYQSVFGNRDVDIYLHLPYFPHARQDRYTGDNAFTLQYSVIPLIVAADVDHITVDDPHSPVCIESLEAAGQKVLVRSQASILQSTDLIKDLKNNFDAVVAPDAGAFNRALEMAAVLELGYVLKLSKTRDPNTGRITYKEPPHFIDNKIPKSVIMFDDIGDGCWTHILAANALKDAGVEKVTLVLTHGVLSKGVAHLYPAIDKLIVIHDWRSTKGLEVKSLNSFI